jgi:imidazole glycerol-phosphate synthase subunit HisF
MLRPRLIPCLLIHNGGLVKTVQFGEPKYVGDPLNAVRIFNEKEVDELMVIDIDHTRNNTKPDEKLIAELAAECRMPLSYGGGITSVEQVERLIALGVEKVAISAAAIATPDLISKAAERVGRQSIVGVIDVKRTGILRRPEVVTHNGTKRTGLNPVAHAENLQRLGVGEIVLNSVDRDGKMEGYDLELLSQVREKTSVPLTILGGAGNMQHVTDLVERFPVIGAAAGSMFVFKGKYRAVLINYPQREERDALARA